MGEKLYVKASSLFFVYHRLVASVSPSYVLQMTPAPSMAEHTRLGLRGHLRIFFSFPLHPTLSIMKSVGTLPNLELVVALDHPTFLNPNILQITLASLLFQPLSQTGLPLTKNISAVCTSLVSF